MFFDVTSLAQPLKDVRLNVFMEAKTLESGIGNDMVRVKRATPSTPLTLHRLFFCSPVLRLKASWGPGIKRTGIFLPQPLLCPLPLHRKGIHLCSVLNKRSPFRIGNGWGLGPFASLLGGWAKACV